MTQIIVTKEGFEKLKKELNILLKEKKPLIIEDIKKAQEDNNCDISENIEFLDASNALDRIAKKIKEIEDKLMTARIIETSDIVNNGTVKFGTTVELLKTEENKKVTYKIVGEEESSIKEGKISYLSPLAKEIMGLEVGDYLECVDVEYEILSIKII